METSASKMIREHSGKLTCYTVFIVKTEHYNAANSD
jgi:hypothetical protein